ncbi:MAG: MFS transporter, partial [Bryobacteraceae bacterium]
ATTLRAIVSSPPALLGSAFLNGLFMSFWAVSLPPAVAGLTNQRNRALGFSLITSFGIGIGAVAALLGGYLPALLMHVGPSLGALGSKRMALLAGSALAALAAIPATRLAFPAMKQPDAGRKIYPSSRFVYAFLAATFVWSIGAGGFNPFFNVYFSRHLHLPVERIGYIVSYAQSAQVFVILLAPLVVRRIGEVRSVVSMQLATAAMLALLGLVSSPAFATAAYIAYMCFQYMSEPCLFSMLMTRVAPSEQTGASALNFLITSLAGIFAAIAAGRLFTSAGYGPALAASGAAMVMSAGLFYALVRR